ncbi:F-box protein FBW2-like [Impatiens glandulifera]|uniref:F-box protein FBW2-like n=1 Tax=Impatiens glandulifera TaxID=253017 RepID=UPI001FB07481|nr:F-box protein FBW2-like [Impatiens glandulifera]
MEDQVSHVYRRWADLMPEMLEKIFCRLSVQELLMVVPCVCKPWGKAVKRASCWQEIDIEEWCDRSTPQKIDQMVRMLVNRSGGSMRKLYVSKLCGDHIFSFIADNATSLEVLGMSISDTSNEVIVREANKFSNLTSLDLSYCLNVGALALEAIGKNCPHLSTLRRNMHPFDDESLICQIPEAFAIAETMPKLKQLEISALMVDTFAMHAIIENCQNLEFLDVRDCWNLFIDHEEMKLEFPKLKILGPELDYEQDKIITLETFYNPDYPNLKKLSKLRPME